MNIYVGNISFNAKEQDVKDLFSQFGDVDSVRVITDKYSGRSKGFCFVDMPTEDQAKAAIAELDGKEFMGRNIKVNEARPRTERPRQDNQW